MVSWAEFEAALAPIGKKVKGDAFDGLNKELFYFLNIL
jgi:hypothetical protein